jgi:hypothetical protein
MWTGLALVVLWASGCGGADKPVPVEGIVLLDGKPVDGATVTFVPDGGRGRPASGITDSEGHFQLTTQDQDGAVPGNYRVVVRKTPGLARQPPPVISGDPQSIKAHYKNRLSRKSTKSLLPAHYGDESRTPFRLTVPPPERVKLELQS